MIPEYINNWLYIIESMKNENTYKLAWERALVECIYRDLYVENLEGRIVVTLENIAKCMLKYYWNQIFFFNLKQSPTRVDNRQPYVVQHTNELIEIYKENICAKYGIKMIRIANNQVKDYELIISLFECIIKNIPDIENVDGQLSLFEETV